MKLGTARAVLRNANPAVELVANALNSEPRADGCSYGEAATAITTPTKISITKYARCSHRTRPAPSRASAGTAKLTPITQVRRTVEDAFLGLGYEVRDDREVETVEMNFDKLAFLPTHSARSPRDTFFFDETRVLRTETSPSQIHILEEKPPPIYMVSIGRVYRRDAITATRFPIFHQFEGSRSTGG